MTSLEWTKKLMLFSKMKVKTMFLHFWCVLCEIQHLQSLYLDLVFLKSLGSSHNPEEQQKQKVAGYAGLCLSSQLKELDSSLFPAVPGFNLQSPF